MLVQGSSRAPVQESRVRLVLPMARKKINSKSTNAGKKKGNQTIMQKIKAGSAKTILRAKLAEQVKRLKTSTTDNMNPKRCVIYTRTNSKTNVQGSSTARQVGEAVKALALMTKAKVVKKDITTVSDCISGMLPVHRRQRLVDIITSGQFQAMFVESTRALARGASVAEHLATIASEHGVQLIPGDFPTVYCAVAGGLPCPPIPQAPDGWVG